MVAAVVANATWRTTESRESIKGWLNYGWNLQRHLTSGLRTTGPVGKDDSSSSESPLDQVVSDGEVKQVNTLLYCVGEEAEAVLTSTNATEEDREVYDTVVAKFDAFFKVRRNVIFERARFNRRSQLVGESAEQFIMELYTLAEHCNYGDMTDEMIRDRLVVGIQDAALSQLLQLDAELTLEKAKKRVRQREAVAEQQQALKGTAGGAITLDGIHSRRAQQSRAAASGRQQ